MNDTGSLLQLFEPTPIYEYGQSLALAVYMTATPTLLILAIFIRTMETQLDVLAGQGRWNAAARDFIGYGLLISVFFGAANLVADFMNALYAWIDSFGSMKAISDNMAALINGLKDKASAQAEEQGILQSISDNLTTLPTVMVSLLLYYVSLIAVSTLHIFLKIAHAIGYSVGIAYGLIAIPLSITRSLKLLKGWATFMLFLLLWPVVEGFAIGLFSPMFTAASQTLIENPSLNVGTGTYSMYLFFTILNIIVAGILIAAPLVAGSLAANLPSHSQLVAPFATSAVAASAALFKGATARRDSRGAVALASASTEAIPSARWGEPQPRSTPAPIAQATASANPASASDGTTPGAGASAVQATPADTSDTSARSRQQRRGAIINQQRKTRTE